MTTNLIKDTKFRQGGYARTRAWGTRIYKVLGEYMAFERFSRTKYREVDFPTNVIIGGKYVIPDGIEEAADSVLHVVLMKVGETNKGNFRFVNGKPFTVYAPSTQYKGWRTKGGTLTWYYPCKAVKQGFTFKPDVAHVTV